MAARLPNGSVYGIRLGKMKAVAKCISLTRHRIDIHFSEGKNELQLHELAYRDFDSQYGPYSRRANVHRPASQDSAGPRMNRDIDLDFESRMAPRVK